MTENENMSQKPANAQEEKNIESTVQEKNQVYLRGVVRSISQELDAENRIQNATVITTPATENGEYKSSGLITVFWGDNDRARKKLADIQVGDHLVVQAILRTFQTPVSRGIFFYGMNVEKAVPGGLSGLGDYEADRNEGLFVGTLKSEYKVNNYFTLLNMVTHTRHEGREVVAHPTFNIGGPLLAAYTQNKEKFGTDKHIGAVCQIRQRVDKRTDKEINEWKCFALMYEDENGEMKPLEVPNPLRRHSIGGRRRVHIARSTAEEDLKRVVKDPGVSEENLVAEESKPDESLSDVLETIE